MKQKPVLFTLLILAVLAAGCVETNGEGNGDDIGDDTDIGQGDIIQSFSTDAPSIYADSQTQIALTLQNPQDRTLESVEVSIGNYGRMEVDRMVPETVQDGGDDTRCGYPELSAGAGTESPDYRCIWRMTAGTEILGDARDSITFPLTAFVTYRSDLATDDSVDVSFQHAQDIRPGDRQGAFVRGGNQEVDISLSHESPVPAEDGEVPVTVEVQNIGEGDIVGVDDARRDISISFDGTLADARWDIEETTCVDEGRTQTVHVDEDREGVTLSCTIVLDEPELADRTYTLYTTAEYRYRHISETPLTVLRPE